MNFWRNAQRVARCGCYDLANWSNTVTTTAAAVITIVTPTLLLLLQQQQITTSHIDFITITS